MGKKTTIIFHSLLTILGIAVLTACATTAGNQYVSSNPSAYAPSAEQGRWMVGDHAFERKLSFSKSRERSTNGLLEAQVTLTNSSRKTVFFETRFEWYDSQGFKIENAIEMWKPGQVYGKSTVNISAIAPSTSAVMYRFFIRKSRPAVH